MKAIHDVVIAFLLLLGEPEERLKARAFAFSASPSLTQNSLKLCLLADRTGTSVKGS